MIRLCRLQSRLQDGGGWKSTSGGAKVTRGLCSSMSYSLSTLSHTLSTLSCSSISSTVIARKTRSNHNARWFCQIHQEWNTQRRGQWRCFTRGPLHKAKARSRCSVQEKQLERRSIDSSTTYTTSATIVRRSCLGEETQGENSIAILISTWTKLKTEKNIPCIASGFVFFSPSHNKLSAFSGTGARNLCSSPLSLLHLQMSPSLTILSLLPSQVDKYFQKKVIVIPQILPPTAQTHNCFLGKICPPSVPFLLLLSQQGLQSQVSRRPILSDCICTNCKLYLSQLQIVVVQIMNYQAPALPPPRQLARRLSHSCCHRIRPLLELYRDQVPHNIGSLKDIFVFWLFSFISFVKYCIHVLFQRKGKDI